jgi:hypothetical protein
MRKFDNFVEGIAMNKIESVYVKFTGIRLIKLHNKIM